METYKNSLHTYPLLQISHRIFKCNRKQLNEEIRQVLSAFVRASHAMDQAREVMEER